MTVKLHLIRPNQGSLSESVLSKIGDTPLFRLERIDREFQNVSIYAKAEWMNPGGSVKDRPALNMILAAEKDGRLTPDKAILDATSGNTGIALAMIGAARGYRVTLAIPRNASPERIRILRAYGAELLMTAPEEGTDGAIVAARDLARRAPDHYVYLDQYGNESNWRAHYESTADEIWQQSAGVVTHFVCGLGTSGTFVGTSRRLKERNPGIQCVSVQPDGPFHGMEGLKHMDSAMVPAIYDPSVADADLRIPTETAYRMVLRVSREEGLLVGVSSGAALAACVEVARRIPENQPAMIVTVFPDNGEKYLSERFWDELPGARSPR